jgi:hypothetical protein
MINKLSLLVLNVFATGCMVEIDAPEITIERTCDRTADCTFRGIADDVQAQVPLELASGTKDIDVDLGSDGILEAHYGAGPISLDTTLGIDALVIHTLDGVTLDGMQSLEVRRGDGVVIAFYEPGTGGSASANELRLDGNPDVNLLELGTKFTIELAGSGRMPSTDWMANLEFHVRMNARAE